MPIHGWAFCCNLLYRHLSLLARLLPCGGVSTCTEWVRYTQKLRVCRELPSYLFYRGIEFCQCADIQTEKAVKHSAKKRKVVRPTVVKLSWALSPCSQQWDLWRRLDRGYHTPSSLATGRYETHTKPHDMDTMQASSLSTIPWNGVYIQARFHRKTSARQLSPDNPTLILFT